MNNQEDADVPTQRELVRRGRVRRDKERLESEMRGLTYERNEVRDQMRHASKVYEDKVLGFGRKMNQILDRQREVLKKTDKLLQLDGKCSVYTERLLGHKDSAHKTHVCELEHEHTGEHLCACGSKFRMKPDVSAEVQDEGVNPFDIMSRVLDGWIEGAKENHEASDHRYELRDAECWAIFAVEDIKRMIEDARREYDGG